MILQKSILVAVQRNKIPMIGQGRIQGALIALQKALHTDTQETFHNHNTHTHTNIHTNSSLDHKEI